MDVSDRLLNVAAALADGRPVDWPTLESSASSEAERRQLRHLRLVRQLADAHGSASWSSEEAPLHESLLHPEGSDVRAWESVAPVSWGPLKVIEKIGRGRFGDVYRAWDPRLDREVALKLIRRRDSEGLGVDSLVIEEGRLLAKVRHPNVVTVYGAERIDDRAGMWMELIAGRTLEDEVKTRGAMTAGEVAAIGVDVCRALAAVHRAGLVHRDVKAQNVMRDPDGRIVLMDFGTGRETQTTTTVDLAGTPLYLAPEVLNGAPASPQSDIYSTGVLLYHLATGSFPVNGRTIGEIREAHAKGRIGRAADVLPASVTMLAGVIDRALLPNPRSRFASASDMAQALAECGDQSASTETPRRTISRSAATVALALLAIVGGTSAVTRWNRTADVPVTPSSHPASPSVRQVWSGPGVDGSGGLTPDGRYLTFTDWETGDLAVRDLVSGTSRRLTNTGGWAASGDYVESSVISPDGRTVAYLWFLEDGPSFEIRIKPLDSRDPREFRSVWRGRREDHILPVGFMPDGSRLVVMRWLSDAAAEIGMLSLDDGSYRALKRVDATEMRATLSPDSRLVAYASRRGDGQPRDVFVLSTDGSLNSTIVTGGSDDFFPIWSPDGAHLFFLSDRAGTTGLWSVPVSDGKAGAVPVLVKGDTGPIRPLGLSRSGSLHYYVAGRERRNVQIVQLDGSGVATSPAPATDRFVNSNVGPAWSPNGDSLAYFSFRPAPTLVVRSVRSGEERDVTLPATLRTPFSNGPAWFPDNTSLLILTADPEADRLLFRRLTLPTAAVQTVHVVDETNLSSYALTPDGKAIVYVHQHIGDSSLANGQIVRYDLVTRQKTILKRDEWFIAVAASPNGRDVAYVKSIRPKDNKKASRTVIEVMPATGGPSREIFSDPNWYSGHRYNSLGWSADGRFVLFVGEDGGLRQAPAAGGAATELGLKLTPRIKTPAVHPDGDRMAFGTIDADTNEVWVYENFFSSARVPPAAAADASVSLQQVAAGPDVDVNAVPTPDGRRLVYTDWTNGNLSVRDLVGGNRQLLTDDADLALGITPASPVVSADGRRVAYTWLASPTTLRVTGIDGTGQRTVFSDPAFTPYPLSWTPDGRHLAVLMIDRNHHTSLEMLSLTGAGRKTLKEFAARDVSFGDISPDGRWMLYAVKHTPSTRDGGIFAVPVQGGSEVLLVRSEAWDRSPHWTPDGRSVVFVSDRTGTHDLWRVGFDNGKTAGAPALLRKLAGQAEPKGFTRDGVYFYGVTHQGSDSYVVDFDPTALTPRGAPRRLTERFQGSNHTPAESPDGRFVAFARGTRTSTTLVVRSADGVERTLPIEVHDGHSASRFGLSWFPDSRSFLFQDWVGGTRKPFLKVDAASGQATSLFDASPNTWFHVRLSPDGRFVYYSEWDSAQAAGGTGPLRLYRRELATGQSTELFRTQSDGIGAFGLGISSDGRDLAFSVNGPTPERLLMTMPAGGGQPRVLYRGTYGTPLAGPIVWTPDKRFLLFTATDRSAPADKRQSIWAIDTATGAQRKLDVSLGSIIGLSASSDGRRLFFRSDRTESEIWAIRNLLSERQAPQ